MFTPGTVGIGRFASDLPEVDEFVSLGEGSTAVLPLPALARQLGIRAVSAKMECWNPTGSYKDRVAAMSLSLALTQGNSAWVATSSGNGGVAMAAYGARAGIPGFLCMVACAPPEKRLSLLPFPVTVTTITGLGHNAIGAIEDQVFDRVRAAACKHNLYTAITAHAFNPDGMRGIDTLAYELADQVPEATHVYVPTGGGGLLSAIARGLWHRRMAPALVACQPAGCAPIVEFLNGNAPAPEIESCRTVISGLQLPHPPDGYLAAEAVRGSGGWATAVDDDAIWCAQRLLAVTEGVFVEPAAATGVAALAADAHQGRLDRTAHPVVVLTGAGWKDLARLAPMAGTTQSVGLEALTDVIREWAIERDGQAATAS